MREMEDEIIEICKGFGKEFEFYFGGKGKLLENLK